MRVSTIVTMGAALLFGLLAVFVAQAWLSRQAELRVRTAEPAPPVATRTVVVANAALRFGTQLTPQVLREVAWPDGAVPAGSFSSIAELTSGKRIMLSAIQPNEPVLSFKVTGPGQRATLSALIQEGKKAITVRVNDVEGVAGFVLPGDHVDVLMTRQPDKTAGTTDVVLQNVRVLAVDQVTDDSSDRPMVVKAVTLEVDMPDAQRLSLAASTGLLSLVLRKAGETATVASRRISVSDLGNTDAPVKSGNRFATVVVMRGSKTHDYKTQDYNVPAEAFNWRAASRPDSADARQQGR